LINKFYLFKWRRTWKSGWVS